MINGVSDITRANQYSAKQRDKAAASFGQQLSEAVKQRMQTAPAYETGIHTGPLVAGTEVPASREGVAVETARYADGLPTVSRLAAPAVEPTAAAPETRTLTGIAKEAMAKSPGAVQIFMPKENTVCSQGRGKDQYVYAEYTADSTPEDPIVRIYCRSNSGTYEYTCRLNEVDPSSCTYAELAALCGHQVKSGEREPIGLMNSAVPVGYEIGDFMQKQNFLAGLEDLSNSKLFGQGILTDAKAFLAFYAGLTEEKEQRLEETAAFEALMNAVDNVIEGGSPMEPREMLERLSEPAKDTLEDIKAGEDVSREEWKGLLEELRDMGAISDTEFTCSRSDLRLIPVGYRDENGELVMYDGIAERFGMLDKLRSTSGGMGMLTDAAGFWAGDPLACLDAWIANLAEWREDLSGQRGETGAPKYHNFSPIDDQIDACAKVGGIVNGLLEQLA